MTHDDDPRLELTQRLLFEAGKLMEDTSAEFALAQPDTKEGLNVRIAALEAVAGDLQALATAARTLFRLSNRGD